jgi:hypothetical protein
LELWDREEWILNRDNPDNFRSDDIVCENPFPENVNNKKSDDRKSESTTEV